MIFEMKLKDILEKAEKATVVKWHVAPNGRMRGGEDMLEIVTDKASFDVQAPCDGRLARIIKGEGESAVADDVIAQIEKI